MTPLKIALLGAISASLISCGSIAPVDTATNADSQEGIQHNTITKQAFLEKRTALIIKHSHHDKTFAALQAQVKEGDLESAEYWSWRIDQYMYGQYPEYQKVYNAYKQGKRFNQIYDLPAEDLSAKKPFPSTIPALPDGFFTDNLKGNPHTGSYELVGDKVFITYQGKLTDPYVAIYDLSTQTWQGPVKAAESTLSKGDRKIDSHGRPIIEIDGKGHLHIIYGGHGGEREDGLNPLSIDTPHAGGRMLHVMSEKPYDISSFVQVNDISPFASYTASEKMDNGDIYFFTRAGTHKSPWLYYKMKNGEQQFEKPVVITWPTPQLDNPINVDTFYIKPRKVSATEIVISALWHECNYLEYHDKTTYSRVNTYYMKLDTTTDNFYSVENEKLALPITLETADKKLLAFDSTQREETPFSTKPLILEDNRPAVAYLARIKDFREWRMVSFQNGEWKHSQPMPGIVSRTLFEKDNTEVAKLISFELLAGAKYKDTAVAIYRSRQGKTVFATVKRTAEQNWQVIQEHVGGAKMRMEMQAIKTEKGNAEAIILNVRKDAAQRIYLWQDGEFKAG